MSTCIVEFGDSHIELQFHLVVFLISGYLMKSYALPIHVCSHKLNLLLELVLVIFIIIIILMYLLLILYILYIFNNKYMCIS